LELDANRIINNLTLKVADLTKQITFLEVENLTLKEELDKDSKKEG
jgi:hypothetical protein